MNEMNMYYERGSLNIVYFCPVFSERSKKGGQDKSNLFTLNVYMTGLKMIGKKLLQ